MNNKYIYTFYDKDDQWVCSVEADDYATAAKVCEEQLGYVPPKYTSQEKVNHDD